MPPERKPETAAPRRIDTLAVLPVFLKLAGRRVVLAGGDEGAAWKAELLAADAYEVSDYRRIAVTLRSGLEAFVYVDASDG